MDPRLLEYYDRELQYMREMGGEFAREFPKIAGRLGLDAFECADPYVERLLEGFAFLAARVQLKVDAEFPRFTQHLLEMVYPHYLPPVPSMAVVQVSPNMNDGSIAEGFLIPRDSQLRSGIVEGEQTACEYRTAHDVTLWPLEIAEAEYLDGPGEVAGLGIPHRQGVKAGLRLRLRSRPDCKWGSCPWNGCPCSCGGAKQQSSCMNSFWPIYSKLWSGPHRALPHGKHDRSRRRQ